MLLNLSNHPSNLWTEVQKQQANKLFGEIVDMPFPAIDPAGDESYIEQLANEYLQKILLLRHQHPSLTVHLMGELTFCFAMVQLLKSYNIPCVASTTTRKVVITDNNKKISEFIFVRFRYY